jgi:hypothetical protein
MPSWTGTLSRADLQSSADRYKSADTHRGSAVKLEVRRRPIRRDAGNGTFPFDGLLSENGDPCGFKQAHDLKRDVPED